jgi:CRISPR-associated protein Csd2
MSNASVYPEVALNPEVRHDFVLLFDVVDGNPNGDPDNGNIPRHDFETMHGVVTDVAIKRKVRDWVSLTKSDDPLRQIYVQHRGILAKQQEKAYKALGIDEKEEKSTEARAWMCEHFFDVRMFGAVMSGKKYNAGQVRGPVQFTFARSIDQIHPVEITITRVALTNADDIKGGSADDEEARSGQMGKKAYIPYGLYRAYGFFNPAFAAQTKVNAEDLAILLESLTRMWDVDRSANRGMMACRGLYVFSHDHAYGNAHSHDLFELLSIKKKEEVEGPTRKFGDYDVSLPEAGMLPEGVTFSKIVG